MQIGIDFGTSTTFLASREGRTGSPQLQPLGENTSWLPSVIAVVEKGHPNDTETIPESELGTASRQRVSVTLGARPEVALNVTVVATSEGSSEAIAKVFVFDQDNWSSNQFLDLQEFSSDTNIEPELRTSVAVAEQTSETIEILLGDVAVAHNKPSEIIRSIKSHIYSEELQSGYSGSAIDLTKPEQVDDLITELLSHLRSIAISRDFNKFEKSEVFLSCPAVWEAKHRRRLVEIAQEAGLNCSVNNIIDEPIAAGVSWIWNEFIQTGVYPGGKTIVFDCGGGTLDIAILEVDNKKAKEPIISVLSSNGSYGNAGDDYDEEIFKHLEEQYPNLTTQEEKILLKQCAKRLKESLSSTNEAIDYLGQGYNDPISFTQEELKECSLQLFQKSKNVILGAMRLAKVREPGFHFSRVTRLSLIDLAEEYDQILFAGGMSQSPALQNYILEALGGGVEKVIDRGVDSSEESIVHGLTYAKDILDTLNLDRPAISFFARYEDKDGNLINEDLLYEAFTPLFHPTDLGQQVLNPGKLYELRAAEGLPNSPQAGQEYSVTIFCQSLEGTNMPLVEVNEDDNSVEDVSVRLKRIVGKKSDGNFKLNADGTLILNGQTRMGFRVVRWPSAGSRVVGTGSRVEVQDLSRFTEYPFEGH